MLQNNNNKLKKTKVKNKFSNKLQKTKKSKKIQKIQKLKSIKFPKIKPYKLKVGVMKRSKDGKLWKVVIKNNKKIWIRANINDIKCYNYLHNSIKSNIAKYKNNNKQYKSINQAVAIAYSMTKKKFPNCKL